MSRITDLFARLKKDNRKAFIAYITAGDPSVEFSENLIYELDKSGVDLLEVGVPFSDPLADGPTIQEASNRALKHNMNLKKIFSMIKNVRKKTELPMILFTYLNPVYKYGMKKFVEDTKKYGIDGVLILDFSPEESEDYIKDMRNAGLDTIFIAAPTTDKDRLKIITDCSSGFIYYVSRTGVTGEQSDIDSEISSNVREIKSMTDKPVAIGFGISNPQQVKAVSEYGDAVVVGSAIVRRIKENKDQPDGYVKVGEFVKNLVEPLK